MKNELPGHISKMKIGERKIFRFYISDSQYYDGMVVKTGEIGEEESFKGIGKLTLRTLDDQKA